MSDSLLSIPFLNEDAYTQYLCVGKTNYTRRNSLIEPLSESEIRAAIVAIANTASFDPITTQQNSHCIEESIDDAVTVVDDNENQMDDALDDVIIHSQDTVFADAIYGFAFLRHYMISSLYFAQAH